MNVTPAVAPARSAYRLLRDVLVIVVLAGLVAFGVRTFLVRSFYIPSASMQPTLQIDDHVLVNLLQPKAFPLERGDIVVFEDPGSWLPDGGPAAIPNPVSWLFQQVGLAPAEEQVLIKRVVGLPGDRVECCSADGRLRVNGQPIDEPYLQQPGAKASELEFAVTVPEDAIWVMGDNRGNSADSRAHLGEPGKGFVPMDAVIGRAAVVSWPIWHWQWLTAPE
jgi:signal peptidase I